MKLLSRWQKENKISSEKLGRLVKRVVSLLNKSEQVGEEDPELQQEFKEFLDFIGASQQQSTLTESLEVFKILQEGVWGGGDRMEGLISIVEALMMLIGTSTELKTSGKYELAFTLVNKDLISIDDLFSIERAMSLSANIPEQKIRSKYANHRNKKENQNKNMPVDEMDLPFYLDLIASYPTCFQG